MRLVAIHVDVHFPVNQARFTGGGLLAVAVLVVVHLAGDGVTVCLTAGIVHTEINVTDCFIIGNINQVIAIRRIGNSPTGLPFYPQCMGAGRHVLEYIYTVYSGSCIRFPVIPLLIVITVYIHLPVCQSGLTQGVAATVVPVIIDLAANGIGTRRSVALGDSLGGDALGMGVACCNLVAALYLQRAVVSGISAGCGDRACVISAARAHLGQGNRLGVSRRKNSNRHLYRGRAGLGIVHPDIQRVARLETISRRLEAVVGEEVNLRAHRAAGRGERGRNRLRCTLVVGLVLVGGGDRVAVAHRDGVVTRCGGAVAVGVDGARENAGVRRALGKRHLLNVGGAGGNGYDDGAITVQVRVVQLDVQRIAGSELRHDAVKDVVGEPQRPRCGLTAGARVVDTEVLARNRRTTGHLDLVESG